MRTKLLRINEKDFVKHVGIPLDPDTMDAPIYFCYAPHSGYIQIWPPDLNNRYELILTIEEKH